MGDNKKCHSEGHHHTQDRRDAIPWSLEPQPNSRESTYTLDLLHDVRFAISVY